MTHHETLQGKLQELLSWVSGTAQSLDSSDYHHGMDANSLSRCLQHYKVTMAMPLILPDGWSCCPLCRGEAFNPAPLLEPWWVCHYPSLQEEQQYCICSKVICFHNA